MLQRAARGGGDVRHRRLLLQRQRARTSPRSSPRSSRGRSARARSTRVAGDGGAAARAAAPDRRARGCCPSSRRPSAAWAAWAASSSSSRTPPAAARWTSCAQRDRRSWSRKANQEGRAARRLHLLHRGHAAAGRGGGPPEGQGAGRADRADLRHAAALHGQPVRQRLQLRQPHLPRVRAGRAAVPRQPAGHRRLLRAQRQRGHDPAGVAGEGDAHHQRADHPPLQPVPLGGDQRPGRARACRPARRWTRWRRWPPRRCRRAWAPSGRASAWSRRRAAGRRWSSSRWACVFVFLVLAAQYESFSLPFVVILSVPLAILGALGLQVLRGLAERRVLPGRAGDAGGPGQQERHPHRGVRRAAARAGQERAGGGGVGGRGPAAAHPDDVDRLPAGRGAADAGHAARARRRATRWAPRCSAACSCPPW